MGSSWKEIGRADDRPAIDGSKADFKIDIPASIVEWLRAQEGPAQPSITLMDANRRLILTGRLVLDDVKCRLKDVEVGPERKPES